MPALSERFQYGGSAGGWERALDFTFTFALILRALNVCFTHVL